jgi:hypothetical protein
LKRAPRQSSATKDVILTSVVIVDLFFQTPFNMNGRLFVTDLNGAYFTTRS